MTGRLSGVPRAFDKSRRFLIRLALRLSALVVVCFASPVMAERLENRGTADEQAACTPDVFRLCAQFIPSESRIVACLMQSRPRLSPACGRVFAAAASRQARNTTSSRRVVQRRKAVGSKKTTKKPTTRTTQARKVPVKKPLR